MTHKTIRALLLVIFFSFAISGKSNPVQAGATATVKAFYAYHFAHKFDYSKRGLLQRRKWLDDTLYKLLVAEVSKPTKADEAPEMNGDPFTNSQEYPTTFRIGNTNESAAKATIQVIFIWKEQGKVIDERPVDVELVKNKNLWKIANIISGSEPDDNLLQFLQRSR
ncbi:MAG: DUF3828 domain-containing protein [Acidobacteriota bacterium]